ncbi:hypothetical protein J2O09_09675 [Elizabethkingia anophelis]|uniref:hypothetical protein n=1 Tax=Elizabethkingia anophelis TaxID=1117645 RepID=UPI0020B75EA4|nr:hypothetical protein [Elizabethkingia anophelis]MCT4021837.1 hypothetical protein [Elizabethkingia anophelis]MCT4055237.1 hypothetical protein [Elizabethkingia anophelis]UTG59709.1 hypothetical protein J2O09_09675 [Elizabethkingia anophelis]UXM65887.1 hypothetical protein N7E57_09690 [Elizabethkingia anophelis]
MKKITFGKQLILSCLSILFISFSCSRSVTDSPEEKPVITESIPKISTLYPSDFGVINVTLGGEIKERGNTKIIKKGVCWSINGDPVIENNNYKEDRVDSEGKFYFALANELKPATKYFVRAYYETAKGIVFGDTISFTTGATSTIKLPINIFPTSVTLRGEVVQGETESRTVGFVYSTKSNPTMNDNKITKDIFGSASYEMILESGLKPNTNYYVRGFVINRNGEYSYTEEKQFRTTGYYGQARGYVVFDKGEVTDGWRYLETMPDLSIYNGKWGPANKSVPGTSSELGKGLENTEKIAQIITQSESAGTTCHNIIAHGFSDWFLPSSDELVITMQGLRNINININSRQWSSTERDILSANSVIYKDATKTFEVSSVQKESYLGVMPIRRY